MGNPGTHTVKQVVAGGIISAVERLAQKPAHPPNHGFGTPGHAGSSNAAPL